MSGQTRRHMMLAKGGGRVPDLVIILEEHTAEGRFTYKAAGKTVSVSVPAGAERFEYDFRLRGIIPDEVLFEGLKDSAVEIHTAYPISHTQNGEWQRTLYSNMPRLRKVTARRLVIGGQAFPFYLVPSLEELRVEEWDTSRMTAIYGFLVSNKLTEVPGWETWDLSKVGPIQNFINNTDIERIDTPWTARPTTIYQAFCRNRRIKSLRVSTFDMARCTSCAYAFCEQPLLEEVVLENFEPKACGNFTGMFFKCPSLRLLEAGGNFDMGGATTTTYMFGECPSLTHIGGRITNIRLGLSFSSSPLDLASARMLIEGLHDFRGSGDMETTRTLTLSRHTKSLLGGEDIAAASAKGWNIA